MAINKYDSMSKKEYDGIITHKNGKYTFTEYNIDKALNQKNIRNVFLNGQLFTEMLCDSIICLYLTQNKNPQQGILSNFLKSRHIDFFSKIELLKMLENKKRKKFIDKDIIISLKAIGAVRNAFQHNLRHEDALRSLTDGDKFAFKNKVLSTYTDVGSLVLDFKLEVRDIFIKLHSIILEIPTLE